MSKRSRGYIRWFSHQKRYGRIQLGSGHPDIFVKIEGWQDIEGVRKLKDGELVEFSIEQTPAGPIALNIVLLSSEQ